MQFSLNYQAYCNHSSDYISKDPLLLLVCRMGCSVYTDHRSELYSTLKQHYTATKWLTQTKETTDHKYHRTPNKRFKKFLSRCIGLSVKPSQGPGIQNKEHGGEGVCSIIFFG